MDFVFFHDFEIEGPLENSCKDLSVVLQVTGKMSEFPKARGDNQGTLGISKMTEWNVAPTPSPKWIQ